jgi:hypothetical protein
MRMDDTDVTVSQSGIPGTPTSQPWVAIAKAPTPRGISPVVPGVVAAGLLGAAALIVRHFRRSRRHSVIGQHARRRPVG